MTVHIKDIIYYPLKGVGGESITKTRLGEQGIRHDRRYAITFGDSLKPLFAADKWKPWTHCHTLKNTAQLARLSASASDDGGGGEPTLHIAIDNRPAVCGCPANAADKTALETFLRQFLDNPAVRLADSRDHPLWDEKGIPLTLLNDASVAALAAADKMPPQLARFRANIIFSGLPAWREETLSGAATLGAARLNLAGGVPRCSATFVNPDTASRDFNIPDSLRRRRGHINMGLFATIIGGGDIAVGQEIRFESA